MTARYSRGLGRPVGQPKMIRARQGRVSRSTQPTGYAQREEGQLLLITTQHWQIPATYSSRPVGLAGARHHHNSPTPSANRIAVQLVAISRIKRGVQDHPRVQFWMHSIDPTTTRPAATSNAAASTAGEPIRRPAPDSDPATTGVGVEAVAGEGFSRRDRARRRCWTSTTDYRPSSEMTRDRWSRVRLQVCPKWVNRSGVRTVLSDHGAQPAAPVGSPPQC